MYLSEDARRLRKMPSPIKHLLKDDVSEVVPRVRGAAEREAAAVDPHEGRQRLNVVAVLCHRAERSEFDPYCIPECPEPTGGEDEYGTSKKLQSHMEYIQLQEEYIKNVGAEVDESKATGV
ncbi:P-loop containing nucleoside triphosphate hydrolase protein [Apiospora sp. TS-2023a]